MDPADFGRYMDMLESLVNKFLCDIADTRAVFEERGMEAECAIMDGYSEAIENSKTIAELRALVDEVTLMVRALHLAEGE
jgi:hypothetical protein